MRPGKIVISSNKIVDVLAIQPKDITLLHIAHSLALQCRYNGSCNRFYSVAEHSVRCSHFTHICPDPAALLFHDAAEAYIGDIVRGIKYLPKIHQYIKTLEHSIQLAIWLRFKIRINAEIIDKVKTVDDIMLITEALQLGVEKAAYYYNNKDAKPEPGLIIEGWDWQKAQMMFLKRAGEVLKL